LTTSLNIFVASWQLSENKYPSISEGRLFQNFNFYYLLTVIINEKEQHSFQFFLRLDNEFVKFVSDIIIINSWLSKNDNLLRFGRCESRA
jgi:hypothetical protein